MTPQAIARSRPMESVKREGCEARHDAGQRPDQHVLADLRRHLRRRPQDVVADLRRHQLQPPPEDLELGQAEGQQQEHDGAEADEPVGLRRDGPQQVDERAGVVLAGSFGDEDAVALQPLGPPRIQCLEPRDVGDRPVDDVVDAPHHRRRERQDDEQCQQDGEHERGGPWKPGFERLLERLDQRHAEQREGDRLEHDPREIERGDDEERGEEKLDGARHSAHRSSNHRSPSSSALAAARNSSQRLSAQDNDLDQHGDDQPQQAHHVAGRHPARRSAARRLDDGNAGLRRPQEVEQQLDHLEHHHQRREHDAERAGSRAGPGGALERTDRGATIGICHSPRKTRVAEEPDRGECQDEQACDHRNSRSGQSRRACRRRRRRRTARRRSAGHGDRSNADLQPEADPSHAPEGSRETAIDRCWHSVHRAPRLALRQDGYVYGGLPRRH